MSNSNGQNAKRKCLVLCAMAVVLVLALLVHAGIRKHTENAMLDKAFASTWDGVPAALELATQSSQYRDGGTYLATTSMLSKASAEQRDVYSYRLTIDFLRSLTPQQTDFLRRGKYLPFTELNLPQKKALLQLPASRLRIIGPYRINESFIIMALSPLRNDKHYTFDWIRPGEKWGHYNNLHMMDFAGDGNSRKLFRFWD